VHIAPTSNYTNQLTNTFTYHFQLPSFSFTYTKWQTHFQITNVWDLVTFTTNCTYASLINKVGRKWMMWLQKMLAQCYWT